MVMIDVHNKPLILRSALISGWWSWCTSSETLDNDFPHNDRKVRSSSPAFRASGLSGRPSRRPRPQRFAQPLATLGLDLPSAAAVALRCGYDGTGRQGDRVLWWRSPRPPLARVVIHFTILTRNI